MGSQVETPLFICSFPRSGGRHIRKVLNKAGKDVKQERYGPDGIVSWIHLFPGQYGGEPEDRANKEVHVPDALATVHMTRHPLGAISSAQTLTAEARRWLGQHLEIEPKNTIDFLMAAWLEWNERIEEVADWQFCIENLELRWEEFKQITHIPMDTEFIKLPKDEWNSREGRYFQLNWDDLKIADSDLAYIVRLKAVDYGYLV